MFSIDDKNKITIVRGDTAMLTLSLTGYLLSEGDQVKLTVKRSANDAKALITKVVTEFTEGKAIIALEEADTETLAAGKYLYEIECRLKDGRIDTVITATTFNVIADLG